MIAAVLSTFNEIITAAIVIIAVSILLYNLSRNLQNRVARTSGAVLACVTITYTIDVFTSLSPAIDSYIFALKIQWVGLAFLPSTLFHLSDALLATTGLPSRGRRRLGTRFLYGISTVFVLMVAYSDTLVAIIPIQNQRLASMRPGIAFWVYVAYFIAATVLAVVTTQRARNRCLTRATRRRMGYLQFAMLTPAIGIFPYSVLLGEGSEFSLSVLLLVNAANIVVVLMLIFLSYPLSFFGSQIPDRVVKSELMRFFLLGPATGLLILATITVTTQATRIFGIAGETFMPFAVVVVVLMWQWTIAIVLPELEALLIYGDEDSNQLSKLRNLSDRVLSEGDLLQLLGAVLQATCDYLQVNTAFVVRFDNGHGITLVENIGSTRPSQEAIAANRAQFTEDFTGLTILDTRVPVQSWEHYWVAPLYSRRLTDERGQPTLIGLLGVQARSQTVSLTDDEHHRLSNFVHQAEQTLDDMALQREVFAAVEGLLPQFNMTRVRAAEVEYLPGRQETNSQPQILPSHEQMTELVHAALKHYWGGPGLTRSRLFELSIVRDGMDETDNPAHALRSLLQDAIEHQRPQGERKYTDPEWLLYNVLDLRFVQGVKVKDVAKRLARSEADTYRKQKQAIATVAKTLEQWEREMIQTTSGQ